MESNDATTSPMSKTLGKLLAGAFIYRMEDGRNAQEFQKATSVLRKILGEQQSKDFLNATKDQHYAFICACIDQSVLGKITPETKKLFSKLDPTSRILMEFAYLSTTGQNPSDQKNDQRWAPVFYSLRQGAKKYIEMSPSSVSEQELADALKEIALPFMESAREYLLKLL